MAPMQLYRESAFLPQATIDTGNRTTAPQAFLKAFPAIRIIELFRSFMELHMGYPKLHLPN